jgi:hypothetical protein
MNYFSNFFFARQATATQSIAANCGLFKEPHQLFYDLKTLKLLFLMIFNHQRFHIFISRKQKCYS